MPPQRRPPQPARQRHERCLGREACYEHLGGLQIQIGNTAQTLANETWPFLGNRRLDAIAKQITDSISCDDSLGILHVRPFETSTFVELNEVPLLIGGPIHVVISRDGMKMLVENKGWNLSGPLFEKKFEARSDLPGKLCASFALINAAVKHIKDFYET